MGSHRRPGGRRRRDTGPDGVCCRVAVRGARGFVLLGGWNTGVLRRIGQLQAKPGRVGPKIAAARGYTLSFQACSGAKTPEVYEKQLGTLSSSTALVTITIGGNDAGFSNVILNCALYFFTCSGAINEADEFIAKKMPALLETTYKDIRAKATTAEVIVLGYPKLFTKEGATCNVNLLTSGNEKKINETAEKLDGVIKGRAEARKFKFVNPTGAFEAHEVCSSSEWLNGQSNPLEESYHPNVKGQEEFTTLVGAAI